MTVEFTDEKVLIIQDKASIAITAAQAAIVRAMAKGESYEDNTEMVTEAFSLLRSAVALGALAAAAPTPGRSLEDHKSEIAAAIIATELMTTKSFSNLKNLVVGSPQTPPKQN